MDASRATRRPSALFHCTPGSAEVEATLRRSTYNAPASCPPPMAAAHELDGVIHGLDPANLRSAKSKGSSPPPWLVGAGKLNGSVR
jgi:hypothetical protein